MFSSQKLYNWVIEKKQKIAMKKLEFVIVIALGSNCWGVIIWRQYNSPRWELSGGQLSRGVIALGGDCPGGNGGNCPGETVRKPTKLPLISHGILIWLPNLNNISIPKDFARGVSGKCYNRGFKVPFMKLTWNDTIWVKISTI